MHKNAALAHIRKHPVIKHGIWLVLANMLSNIINMGTSILVGRSLSLDYFGVFNIFSSLVFFAGIGLSALASSINYQTSYLAGKYQLESIYHFWKRYQKKTLITMLALSAIWVIITPFLPEILNVSNTTPFLLFTLYLFFASVHSISEGYLSGRMLFHFIAILSLTQTVARLVSAYFFISYAPEYTYASMIIGVALSMVVSTFLAKKDTDSFKIVSNFDFSSSFFFASMITGLSAIAFFSLDNLLVAHFFDPATVGLYGLLGLVGKMIFFVATLILTFLMPLVARNEGSNRESNTALYISLGLVSSLATGAYAFFIIFFPYFGDFLFKEHAEIILSLLPLYGLGVVLFCISQVFSIYYLSKKQYAFPLTSLLIAILQIGAIAAFHETLEQVILVMVSISVCNLVVVTTLHLLRNQIATLQNVIEKKFSNYQLETVRESFTPKVHAKRITLQSIYDEGSLHIGELKKHIDFEIQRFYIIKDVVSGAVRGHHAHYATQQCLFCISGSATIILDNGKSREHIALTHPNQGLYLDPLIWHEMTDFTPDTVLLVIASLPYQEEDYIRNYQEFKNLNKRKL